MKEQTSCHVALHSKVLFFILANKPFYFYLRNVSIAWISICPNKKNKKMFHKRRGLRACKRKEKLCVEGIGN